jgi:nucleoside-diphosphate-sugar epimerase
MQFALRLHLLYVLQLAEKIKEYVPELVIVKNEFKKDFDQRNYIVSNKKLESLGWTPQYSLDDGINELLQGYKLINKYKNKDFTNL